MRSITTILLLLTAIGVSACSTTTPRSRDLARTLSNDLKEYMDDRRTAIDALNAEYRATYASLVGEYRALSDARLQLERSVDARALADAVLVDWAKRTTFSAVSSALEDIRDRQLQAIELRSQALADAQREYARSYADLKLDLKKLEAARKKLVALSQAEQGRWATLRLLVQIARAYNELQKAQEGGS